MTTTDKTETFADALNALADAAGIPEPTPRPEITDEERILATRVHEAEMAEEGWISWYLTADNTQGYTTDQLIELNSWIETRIVSADRVWMRDTDRILDAGQRARIAELVIAKYDTEQSAPQTLSDPLLPTTMGETRERAELLAETCKGLPT